MESNASILVNSLGNFLRNKEMVLAFSESGLITINSDNETIKILNDIDNIYLWVVSNKHPENIVINIYHKEKRNINIYDTKGTKHEKVLAQDVLLLLQVMVAGKKYQSMNELEMYEILRNFLRDTIKLKNVGLDAKLKYLTNPLD